MLWERLARRPPAFEGLDDGRGRRTLCRQFVFDRVGLNVLQLHLQLIEKPLLTFRAHAIKRAPQLFDGDQRLGAGPCCLSRESDWLQRALRALGFPPARRARRGLAQARRPDRREANRRCPSRPKGIIAAWICKQESSASRRRTPSFLRHSPIDALEQIAQLCRRDRDRPVGGRRPEKPPSLQPFREQAQALPIVPQALDEIAAATAKDK